MAKQQKVPGMTETKPNREQRRHPEKFQQPQDQPLSRDDNVTEPAVQDPGAKNSGHGKKTADKWNQ